MISDQMCEDVEASRLPDPHADINEVDFELEDSNVYVQELKKVRHDPFLTVVCPTTNDVDY